MAKIFDRMKDLMFGEYEDDDDYYEEEKPKYKKKRHLPLHP